MLNCAAAASPILYLPGERVPFFVTYGSEDFPRLKVQAEAMLKALAREKTEHADLVLDGLEHFCANEACGDPNSPWVRAARAWLSGSRTPGAGGGP